MNVLRFVAHDLALNRKYFRIIRSKKMLSSIFSLMSSVVFLFFVLFFQRKNSEQLQADCRAMVVFGLVLMTDFIDWKIRSL